MNKRMKRTIAAVSSVALMSLGLLLGGCGGGGGVSSQVVTGVASVGATLAGQVSLKDSSKPAKERSAGRPARPGRA